MLAIGLSLAFVWGVLWALFLQFTSVGQFLATRRTWLTVVVGVGVDTFIMFVCLPWQTVLTVVVIIAASSIGIITRSILLELNDELALREVLDVKQDARRE